MEVINPNTLSDKDVLNQEHPAGESDVTMSTMPNSPAAEDDPDKPENPEFVEGIREAVREAEEEIRQEESESEKASKMPDSASVSDAVDNDTLLKAATIAKEKSESASSIDGSKPDTSNSIPILQEHKDAFISCLISGDRYRETFSKFGGKLLIVVRSRTAEETNAIVSYIRRKVITGETSTRELYSSYVRRAIVAAQIEEVNGVKYPELASPYYFVETPEKMEPPAWEKQMDMWGSKPEQLFSVCADCVIEFEVRYWNMIAHAGDENFWNPGESTGV